jgi:pimeloyl-ACP methyl ester carboxylesterase
MEQLEQLVMTPGGVMPAATHYEPLLRCLGKDVRPLLKDFELYTHEEVPAGYNFKTEVEDLRLAVDDVDFDSFHLIGYSTCLPLAFVAKYPERVRSVCMVEPGIIGHGAFAPADMVAAHHERAALPAPDMMAAMQRSMLAPGVALPLPPPSGSPPPWMAQRLKIGPALMAAVLNYDLSEAALSRYAGPVLVAVGSLDHPSLLDLAERIAEAFPRGRVQVYQGRYHLDPIHRSEPERFAADLRALWQEARNRPPVESSGSSLKG